MITKILDHFKKNDPILYKFAIKLRNGIKPFPTIKENPKNYFFRLCRSIIGQQLSGASAEAIFNRFKKMYPQGAKPELILKTPDNQFRSIGMSGGKTKYLKNLARAIIDNKDFLINLDPLSNEEVVVELIKIKGIGPWTAEMFLMFTLGREDVFSHGDLGLRNGLKKIYGFKKDPSLRTVERIIKKWSPYKTYASLILWESLEIGTGERT